MTDVFEALAAPAEDGQFSTFFASGTVRLCSRSVLASSTMKHDLTLTRQAISQHLDVLEAAGLLRNQARKAATSDHYLDTTPLNEIVKRWLTPETKGRRGMKIVVTSVLVDDQDKALRFYTDVLGFLKKTDIPMGHHRWLTVVSTNYPDGVELLLEPDEHPAARPFKQALIEDGIPFTSFGVEDVQAEYDRLLARWVCISHNRPWRWDRSRRRLLTTPVATSSRLHKSTKRGLPRGRRLSLLRPLSPPGHPPWRGLVRRTGLLISRRSLNGHALALGVLLTLAGVANNLMLPPPLWFWIATFAVFLPATFVGAWLVPRRAPAGATSSATPGNPHPG